MKKIVFQIDLDMLITMNFIINDIFIFVVPTVKIFDVWIPVKKNETVLYFIHSSHIDVATPFYISTHSVHIPNIVFMLFVHTINTTYQSFIFFIWMRILIQVSHSLTHFTTHIPSSNREVLYHLLHRCIQRIWGFR